MAQINTVTINLSPEGDEYWCEICAKQIIGKKNIFNHKSTHQMICCPKCNQNVNKKNKSRHMKNCQGDQAIHQCDQCDRQFATQGKLSAHMRSHQEVLCLNCGKVY